MILLDLSKFQNVHPIAIDHFFSEFNFFKREDELKLIYEISTTKKYHFFIKYFQDQERPVGLDIN